MVIDNTLSSKDINPIHFKYGKACIDYGYSERDLRGVSHLLCAIKECSSNSVELFVFIYIKILVAI
ncbi:MAG: hypothetical protein CVU00_04015 [Bacteroidetes bacterium HGW-Bacteroidetes-17]|jgi:hypothetical protein|nr:MAG: hypothetical protein CVU00_04015 [Bacteroidetes bacterium HGW-Bacteroidetes-17]